MRNQNIFLLTAGLLSIAVAIFQAVIALTPIWGFYFGGGALAAQPVRLLVVGLGLAMLFAAAGLYGLSGAGVVKRLPLLRLELVVISFVYIYRGVLAMPQALVALGYLPAPQAVPQPHVPMPALLSSLMVLVIGLFYLVGLMRGWKMLAPTWGRRGQAGVVGG